MWRKDKHYVLHGMTLDWWFTAKAGIHHVLDFDNTLSIFQSAKPIGQTTILVP